MHTLAHCCLQGVCCAPGSEKAKVALSEALDADLGLSSRKDDEVTGLGRAVADWIDANDMALVPKELATTMHRIFTEAMALRREKDRT